MKELAERVIARCQQEGAETVEVYLQRASNLRLTTKEGMLQQVNRSRGNGLGVRCVIGGALGFAYAAVATPAELEAVAVDACRIARVKLQFAQEDVALPLPCHPPSTQDLGILCPELALAPFEQKVDVARVTDRSVQACGARSLGATYSETVCEVTVVSSSGIYGRYGATICIAQVNALHQANGADQGVTALSCGHRLSDLQPEPTGREAALWAGRLSCARTSPTGRFPVLLSPEVMGLLVSAVGLSFCASQVQRRTSFLCWLPDEGIASPAVTLIDDGLRYEGMASSPFDAEGVPRRRTILIERGRRCSLLHDTLSARKMGAEIGGGNAARKSFQCEPSVSPSNLVLEPGSSEPEELAASIDRGLWVHSVTGTGFGLDPSSGQLSLKARGLWIEKGQPAHAVDGAMIVGQLTKILQGIVALGSDARWQPGYGSQAWTLIPSALVREVAVIGNG